jgi:hypothetical protein
MEEKNDIKQLELEREELNRIVNNGVTFEVEDVEAQVKKTWLFGLFKKRELVKVTKTFKIEEPTLGTLDRLSREWVELAIDEESLKGKDGMKNARSLAANNALRCAKVIAIAVIGSEYKIPVTDKNGVVKMREDVKRLNQLTSLFARTIKPSRLYQIYILIQTMCNLGDFLNSIRLMSADRTTMPIRIEENGV